MQICDGAVVGKDLQVGGGEEHGEKTVVLLAAIMIRIRCGAVLRRPNRTGGSVVPVRDIGQLHGP